VSAEIDDIVRRHRAGELITRAECDLVMSQFQTPEGRMLFNSEHPISAEYRDGKVPGVLSFPPDTFRDDP
jgi:hypothetical protein